MTPLEEFDEKYLTNLCKGNKVISNHIWRAAESANSPGYKVVDDSEVSFLLGGY